MKSIIWKTRIDGMLLDILIPKQSNGWALINCPGLPSSPDSSKLKKFAEKGFYIFNLRYKGTWESEGEFLEVSPVNDVALVIDLIKKRKIKEIYGKTILKLPNLKISIIGSSFGGSVALCCSNLKVDSIIAICPVINFKSLSKHHILNLKGFLKEAYGNCYRFNDIKFDKMLNSEILSPANYINSKTSTLIIQGLQDKTINPNGVINFYNSITNKNKKLILVKNGGHLSTSDLSSKISRIYTWLNEI